MWVRGACLGVTGGVWNTNPTVEGPGGDALGSTLLAVISINVVSSSNVRSMVQHCRIGMQQNTWEVMLRISTFFATFFHTTP